jgi:hypothetical protein
VFLLDHRQEGGPLLKYLWAPELSGQSLYLGGAVGSDDNLYFIPGHAPRVLVCDIQTDRVFFVGPELKGLFKWLRGERVGDIIYGLPCHSDHVLRIHVPTQQVTLLRIPYEDFFLDVETASQQREQLWKYHGGTICPIDKCLYCIPQSATHVLKIDPATDTCTLVGPELPGRYKWYGGVVGNDGAIYGIPHNSSSVLRIHPETGVTLHGDYGSGGHKWHGAARAHNGDIVCVPANADQVLVVRPSHPKPELILMGEQLSTGRHRSDGKYKYLGATAGPNGKVYCFPSGSEQVLEIDPAQAMVRHVGPNLFGRERLCQNKWQNGVLLGQSVYAIPLAAESLLQIDCSHEPPQVTTWPLPMPHKGLAKWEGAIVAPNGVVYTVPNNHKPILRIEPAQWCSASSKTEVIIAADQSRLSRDKKNDEHLIYKSGIPTLRGSAHRVKIKPIHREHNPQPKNRAGEETHTIWLPSELLQEQVFSCEPERLLRLQAAVRCMLLRCDPAIVGSFRQGSERLEDFVVPPNSTWRQVNGGQCESAQKYLSDGVCDDKDLLAEFDSLVTEIVLPHLKRRLVSVGAATDEPGSVRFYYQRPPTLRLQPGPAWAQVKAHNDAEYGHQNGELNFWLPLTDREETGVDLYCESNSCASDYHPVKAKAGEIISFHGSSRKHYVNANETENTRVSLDFRVGVEGFFDPDWEMRGTTDDHCRWQLEL